MALTQTDIAAIWNYKPTGANYTAYQYLRNASDAKDSLGSIANNVTAIKKSTDTLAALAKSVGLTATGLQAVGLKSAIDGLAADVAAVRAALTAETDAAVPSDAIHRIVQDAVQAGVAAAVQSQP